MGIEQKLEDMYPDHFHPNGEPILQSEGKEITFGKPQNKTDLKKDTPAVEETETNWENKMH